MHSYLSLRVRLVAIAAAALFSCSWHSHPAAATAAPQVYVIPSLLPDGTGYSAALGISADGSTAVTRNAKASQSGLRPGDTVVVQGATANNGTVTATSVAATAAGVTTAGGSFGRGFGGGASGATGG